MIANIAIFESRQNPFSYEPQPTRYIRAKSAGMFGLVNVAIIAQTVTLHS